MLPTPPEHSNHCSWHCRTNTQKYPIFCWNEALPLLWALSALLKIFPALPSKAQSGQFHQNISAFGFFHTICSGSMNEVVISQLPHAISDLSLQIPQKKLLFLFLNLVTFTQSDISCIMLKIHYQTLNAVLDNSEVDFLLFQKVTERQQQATAKSNSHSSPTNTGTYLF